MMMNRSPRRGATLVESALVYPVLFLIVLAIVLLGLAVFRYQQVAHIAREASRWASVKGGEYAKENQVPAATPEDVYANSIQPQAAGMQASGLSYSVVWRTDENGNPDKNPTHTVQSTDPGTGLPVVTKVNNTVAVTVTYSWDTGLFGVIPVSSTSVNTICY